MFSVVLKGSAKFELRARLGLVTGLCFFVWVGEREGRGWGGGGIGWFGCCEMLKSCHRTRFNNANN